MVFRVCNFEDFETLAEVRKYFMFQIKITNYFRTHYNIKGFRLPNPFILLFK